ncbi:TPA: hypothetical protein EYP44_04630, partial [Candidatus Bathyarchaeota archaeon]|nr:hypothetical protein [Candidatus Bathyarchaeota archaeon]
SLPGRRRIFSYRARNLKGWKLRRRRPVKRPKAPRIPTRPPVEPRLVRRLCLAIILVIAFLTRVLPARWGPPYHLTGNDPFFQYRSADYVIRNGVQAYFSWLDDMAWHPYGRYIGRTSYPTLPFAAALFYAVVSALGAPVSLYEFCAAFPVLAGVATCLALYAFAEYVGGTETGLLAALFLALCSSHIQRTEFGFFDDESMGVLLLTGLSLLYLRSIEPRLTLRRRLLYGVACGLTLGCLITEWGAHRYALDLLGLFMALVVLLRRYSPSMILPYAATIGVASPFALALPRHGLRGFTSVDWAFLAGVLLVLCLLWARDRFGRRGRALTYALLIAAVATVLALVAAGHVRLPTGKFLAVVNPFHRKEIPIIESVAEHRTTSWDAFYLHMGVLLFLIPVGLYHAARRLGARDIYLIAYGVSSIFFAGSMVRLLLIAAPATCTIAALGVTSTVSPFIDVVRRGPTLPRRLRPRVGVAFSVVLPLTLLALILLPEPTGLVWSTRYVGTPSTLVASSTPKRERVG